MYFRMQITGYCNDVGGCGAGQLLPDSLFLVAIIGVNQLCTMYKLPSTQLKGTLHC